MCDSVGCMSNLIFFLVLVLFYLGIVIVCFFEMWDFYMMYLDFGMVYESNSELRLVYVLGV